MPQSEDLKELKESIRQAIVRGQLEQARRIFEDKVATSEASPEAKAALLAKLSQAGVRGLEPLSKQLREAHGADATSALRFAVLEQDKQPNEALARLDPAARGKPLSKQERAMRAQLLARQGRSAEALEEATQLAAEYPGRADFADAVIRVLLVTRQFPEGIRKLDEALRRFPTAGQFLVRVHRLPLPPKLFQRMYEQVRANWREHPFPPHTAFMFARLALRAGDMEDARSALERARNIPQAAVFGQALEKSPAREWWERARVEDVANASMQMARHPDAHATLLYFPSLYNDFAPFGLRCLDGMLSTYPVNVVYLRDRRFRGFLNGIPDYGDSPRAAAAALEPVLQELGGLPVMTLGVSFGGFAAIRYGGLLNAQSVLSLAGPTLLGRAGEDDDSDDEDDEAGGPAGAAEWRLGLPMEERDTRPIIADRPDMRVTLVLGAHHFKDLQHAKHLEGVPNVETRLIADADEHAYLVHRLVASGEFEPILQAQLG